MWRQFSLLVVQWVSLPASALLALSVNSQVALGDEAPIPAGTVACYTFDYAGNLGQDSSPMGNNLVGTGSPAYSSNGKFGGALNLNGSSKLVPASGFPAGVPIGNAAYTIAAWIKPSNANNAGIVGWGNYLTARQVNAFRTDNSANNMDNYWWAADLTVSAGTSLVSNWHYVAASYDGSTRKIYVDGVLRGQDNPGVNNATAANFAVGVTYGNEYFTGLMDNVLIANRALSQTELQSLMETGGAGPVFATWVGGSTSDATDWGIAANWSPHAVPDSPASVVTFGNTDSQGTADLGAAARYVGAMVFNAPVSTTVQSEGGTALLLDNGTLPASITVEGFHRIAAPVLNSRNLHISGTGQLTIFGAISGTGAVTQAGTGKLLLTGVNSYSGGTNVTGGVLQGNAASIAGPVTLTNGGQVVLDQGSDGAFNTLISGSGSVTKTGAGILSVSGTNTYTGTTTIAQGTLKVLAIPPTPNGAVAHYSFDDGTASDDSGNHLNGTLGTGVTSATGRIGDALRFPGTNAGHVAVAYSNFFNLSTFTISAWVNVADRATTHAILGTRVGGNYTFGCKVMGTTYPPDQQYNNAIHGDVGNGSGWINTNVDIRPGQTGSNGQGPGFAPGTWHMVTYVIDNSAKQFKLYLDADLKNTITFSGTPIFMKSGQSLWIGDDYVDVPTGIQEPMAGMIDDVFIFNRALAASEVTALYQRAGGPGPPQAVPGGSAVTIAAGAKLDMTDITMTIGSLQGGGSVLLGSGRLTTGGNNSSTTFAGVISGAGGLTKAGEGELTLSGASLFTGSTTVTAGNLLINSPGSLVSPVTVGSGGTFGGTGTVRAVTVNSGGHLAPGNSIGTLTLTGTLSLASGSMLDFELGSPDSSDMIFMPSETLVLGSGLQFSNFAFDLGNDFGPGTYVLIDAGTIQGNVTPSSGTLRGMQATLTTSTGNDVVLTVIPEPSTLALLGIGAIGLLACGWRRCTLK